MTSDAVTKGAREAKGGRDSGYAGGDGEREGNVGVVKV